MISIGLQGLSGLQRKSLHNLVKGILPIGKGASVNLLLQARFVFRLDLTRTSQKVARDGYAKFRSDGGTRYVVD